MNRANREQSESNWKTLFEQEIARSESLQHENERLEAALESAKKREAGLILSLKVTAQELRFVRAKQFIAKTERLPDGQLGLFAEDSTAAPKKNEGEEAEKPPKSIFANRLKHDRPGARAKRDAMNDLPRLTKITFLPEADWICDCCGERKVVIGSETSEQTDFVPACYFVIEHVRPKVACKICAEGVKIAPPAVKLIEKGQPGFGLVAHIALSKYGDHLPLNRQSGISVRMGLPIARSTMCDWLKAGAQTLKPVAELIRKKIMESEVCWTDDSPVKLKIAIEAAALSRRLPESRVWSYRGDWLHPYIYYHFTRSRKRDGPREILKGYTGILQADAYAGYNCIYASGEVLEAACLAHVRRKFFEAILSAGEDAVTAVRMIDSFYRVEHEAERIAAKNAYELKDFFRLRLELRQAKTRGLMDQFKEWLDRESVKQLPQSRIGKAIKYTLNNWVALNTIFLNGEVTLDNNLAEGALRRVALGRKNYMFFGSEGGGETAAIFYTLIASAARNGVEPFKYLRDLLTRLTVNPMTDINELLPDRWHDKTSDHSVRMTLQEPSTLGSLTA